LLLDLDARRHQAHRRLRPCPLPIPPLLSLGVPSGHVVLLHRMPLRKDGAAQYAARRSAFSKVAPRRLATKPPLLVWATRHVRLWAQSMPGADLVPAVSCALVQHVPVAALIPRLPVLRLTRA